MRYPLLLATTVAWALWFGGTIAVFVFGLHAFRPGVMSSHAVAAEAVNGMFAVFAKYQVVLAVVTVLGAGLTLATYPSKWSLGLLSLGITALMLAVIWGLALLPIMQGYTRQGMTGTDEFKRLHGQSMVTLTVEAVVLLGAGATLVGMAVRPAPRPANFGAAYPVAPATPA